MATTMTTGTAGLSPTMVTYYDKQLLENMKPYLVHTKYGQSRPLPKNQGKIINFRKMDPLSPALTALTEGVTPDGNSASMTEITAQINQYGDFIEFSDLVELTAIDPLLDEYTELNAQQGAETLDVLARDILHAGTTVQYAAGRASRVTVAAGDVLTVDEVRKAVKTLKNNKAKPAVNRNGRGYYVAIVSPNTTYDLQSDAKWIDIQKYENSEKGLLTGEIGRAYGVIFVETTQAKLFAGEGAVGIDVESTLILGKDAYGVVELEGNGAVKSIYKGLGSSGTADALDQRQTIGWKVMGFTAKILQDLFMIRIEHANA